MKIVNEFFDIRYIRMDACCKYGISRYHQISTDELYGDLPLNRPGHDLRYAIDSTKVEKELGWTLIRNFEEGIKDTVKWYLSNQEWD